MYQLQINNTAIGTLFVATKVGLDETITKNYHFFATK